MKRKLHKLKNKAIFALSISLILVLLLGCSLFKKETKIEISPQKAIYGSPIEVKITGLDKNEIVTLETTSTDAADVLWKATAEFEANKRGIIDLSKTAPKSGDYEGADHLGLFWAMKPINTERKELTYIYDREKNLIVNLTLTKADGSTLLAKVERFYENPTDPLTSFTLDEDGLKGTLYSPTAEGKYPGIILLTGSNGGDIKWLAKAIASNRFSVLTLPYFKYPGLPNELVNIPLEYFEKASHWLKKQATVKEGKIGLIGGSRGGELVLKLGSLFDEYNAIVAWSPAAHLWQGEDYIKLVPSWTYKGEGLSYLGCNFSEEEMIEFMEGNITSYVPYFENCLNNSDPELIKEASIAVENIKANVFFLAGTQDLTWPSTDYVDEMIKRLEENNFAYDYEFIRAEEAGHMVFLPDMSPGNFRAFNGGTPKAELHYSIEAWNKMMDFLHKHMD